MWVLRGLFLVFALSSAAAADVWQAARAPGAVLMMRHALAPGTGDPPEFRLGDCSTQRNLDQAGRAQARAVGRMLASRGIRPDRVLTSRWCRARDTGRLLDLGPPEDAPVLDSFFGDRPGEPAQTAALRRLLAESDPDALLLLVTHQVNITALTGLVPRAGEIVVLVRDDLGGLSVAGRIPPP